jgi:dTDP-glucose 4,6-dehydratase
MVNIPVTGFFVEDHAVAIDLVFHKGLTSYNIGGFNEWQNIDLVKLLCQIMDEETGEKKACLNN